MRDIDNLFLEQMETDKFQKAVSDDFAFVDSLIDAKDLDNLENNKEGDEDAYND